MSVYEMPAEPAVDVLWTHDQETGETIRWTRITTGRDPGWCRPGIDITTTWAWSEVLIKHGPVHDVHPDLAGIPPTPWTWEDGDGRTPAVVAADDGTVPLYDDEVSAFIVRAVNAYVANLGQPR